MQKKEAIDKKISEQITPSTVPIVGQLYGTWYGVEPLPEQWIKKINIQEIIYNRCKEFVALNNVHREPPQNNNKD